MMRKYRLEEIPAIEAQFTCHIGHAVLIEHEGGGRTVMWCHDILIAAREAAHYKARQLHAFRLGYGFPDHVTLQEVREL